MRINFTSKTHLLKESLRPALWVSFCFAILLSINACENKKKSSSGAPQAPPTVPANYYNGNYNGALCPNCGVNVGWAIFAGTDSTNAYGTVTLGLDFYGDPSRGYNFYDPRIPITYSGYVAVRGQMTVSSYDPLLCNIPPGQYQVTSLTAGYWQSGVVTSAYTGYGPTGLSLIAQSQQGVVVRLSLAKGVIYNPNGTYSWYPNKLYGKLIFESLNNYPCYTMTGPASTELY